MLNQFELSRSQNAINSKQYSIYMAGGAGSFVSASSSISFYLYFNPESTERFKRLITLQNLSIICYDGVATPIVRNDAGDISVNISSVSVASLSADKTPNQHSIGDQVGSIVLGSESASVSSRRPISSINFDLTKWTDQVRSTPGYTMEYKENSGYMNVFELIYYPGTAIAEATTPIIGIAVNYEEFRT